jgi:hypothetical protein
MRAFLSHEHARRRLTESFQQNGRLELDDLLRYLEDVSSEPDGEQAYVLALSLRSISPSPENLLDLLAQVRDRLSDFGRPDLAHQFTRERLDTAARFLHAKCQQQKTQPAPSAASSSQQNDKAMTSQPSAPARPPLEDPEFAAACQHGHEIGHSIRHLYKLLLFHNMAALALYWTCFKPSSQSSSEPSTWIEEDVIRIFR